MKLFKIILDGMLSIANSNVEVRSYNVPSDNGFKRDIANLIRDTERLGTGINKVVAKNILALRILR